MSSVDIPAMLESTRELDRLRKELDEVLLEINKLHKKLQAAPEVVEKHGDTSLSRLKSLYIRARDLSDTEANVSSMIASQLELLLPSGSIQQRRRIGFADANEQKRKRMKPDTDSSRPLPTMRSPLDSLAGLKNEQVAAKVTGDNAEKDEWFVVKVTQFNPETKEFEVLDEEPGDDEDGSGQRKYKLPASNIIPFPRRNDPLSAPDFPIGRHVLAVYPGTTALYKATVVGLPRKRKVDDYLLEFDDDEEDGAMPQRTVPFHRVVALPEGHRQ